MKVFDPEESPDDLLERKQAAKHLQVSVITIDRLIAANKLGCFRIGRRILIARRHIASFLEQCEQKVKNGGTKNVE